MSRKLILYNMDLSPMVRAVKIVAHHIGVEFELRNIDLLAGEQLREPFIKINPQHTVPTLDDNGKIIWDSHAICCYLVDKYAKDDSLYPKDLYKRARCTQRLHFNDAILFRCLYDSAILVFRCGASGVPKESINRIYEAHDLLEVFLADDPYLVDDSLTIADICCAVTLTSLVAFAPLDNVKRPKIAAWLDRVRAIAAYKAINAELEKTFVQFYHAKMAENKQKQQ